MAKAIGTPTKNNTKSKTIPATPTAKGSKLHLGPFLMEKNSSLRTVAHISPQQKLVQNIKGETGIPKIAVFKPERYTLKACSKLDHVARPKKKALTPKPKASSGFRKGAGRTMKSTSTLTCLFSSSEKASPPAIAKIWVKATISVPPAKGVLNSFEPTMSTNVTTAIINRPIIPRKYKPLPSTA